MVLPHIEHLERNRFQSVEFLQSLKELFASKMVVGLARNRGKFPVLSRDLLDPNLGARGLLDKYTSDCLFVEVDVHLL
jgi:hypothetical protein